ncbi:MAG: hypothetical protein LBL66_00300 [Clostridiales bacterium]|jgi:hypothetical protein|nr:hypothetical protein [Clostridiales bacterium]
MDRKKILNRTALVALIGAAAAALTLIIWAFAARSGGDKPAEVGETAELAVGQDAAFSVGNAVLSDYGARTAVSKVTVTATGYTGEWTLSVTDAAFKRDGILASTPAYTADDLYILVSDDAGMGGAWSVGLAEGAALAGPLTGARDLYIQVGVGAAETDGLGALRGLSVVFKLSAEGVE